jgi:hypothetical protein
MTRGILTPESVMVTMVVELVTKTPAIESVAIAKALSRSRSHVLKALQAGRNFGLIGCVYIAPKRMGWFPAAMLAQAQADWREQMERRRSDGTQRRIAEMLAKQDDDTDDQPKRRMVSAGSAGPLPFDCRAPASVFHLGAML